MRLFGLFREKELMSRPSLVPLKNKMRRSRKDCNEIFEDQTNDRVNEQRGRFRGRNQRQVTVDFISYQQNDETGQRNSNIDNHAANGENESDEEDIRGMVLNYNFITQL